MRKIIIPIALVLLLSSCGGDDNSSDITQKQDFFIETISYGNLTNQYTLEKSTKLESSSNININSQAPGRVSAIFVKEGDRVVSGTPLVQLSDSVANLGINLSQAKLTLERAQITYDQNKISLDKNVTDSRVNLGKIENNFEALKKSVEQNLLKAKNDLDSSNTQISDSKSSLDLEKLDNSIERLQLDYKNKLIADNETITGFLSTISKEKNNLVVLMNDAIESGDTLLGITDENQTEDDLIKDFLGAKDRGQKSETRNLLVELINYKENSLDNLNISSTDQIFTYLEVLNEGFEKTKLFINSMEKTLNNSLVNVNNFSETDIAGHLTVFNAYQTSYQANLASFVAFDNSSMSFLRTYLNAQESLLQQINLAKKDRDILSKALESGEVNAQVAYNNTVINSMDQLNNLEIQLINAQSNLQNAIDTREVTLRSLNNSIKNARLGLDTAQKEFNKLTIKSPVDGFVAKLHVDNGQEYGLGSLMVTVVSSNNGELVVGVPENQLNKISEGDDVVIDANGKTFNGAVYSKSNLADTNLNYRVRIKMNDDVDLVGNLATIKFKLQADNLLIPINSVRIITGESDIKKGEVAILLDNNVIHKELKLGSVYGDKIEILDGLEEGDVIILSSVRNYDPQKFILKTNK